MPGLNEPVWSMPQWQRPDQRPMRGGPFRHTLRVARSCAGSVVARSPVQTVITRILRLSAIALMLAPFPIRIEGTVGDITSFGISYAHAESGSGSDGDGGDDDDDDDKADDDSDDNDNSGRGRGRGGDDDDDDDDRNEANNSDRSGSRNREDRNDGGDREGRDSRLSGGDRNSDRDRLGSEFNITLHYTNGWREWVRDGR